MKPAIGAAFASALLLPVAYSLASGLAATIAGAAASLLCAGTARIAVWCAVTVAVSVTAGFSYEAATGQLRKLRAAAQPAWKEHNLR
jgi:hypothetical protein